MDRKLTICFTSDVHGFFAPTDYAKSCRAATGLANCAAGFVRDGNRLILDGGDTLQGSPFTYWLYSRSEERSLLPARVMNLAGYDFLTLGNHDFNYGVPELERYLEALDARCLCANVEGMRFVEKTAVVTLENGLRVGLTGVTSPFVPRWEKPENIEGLRFRPALDAAREALEELRAQGAELTVCIYHGGFENDVDSGAVLSRSGENEGWQICRELDFDVLLTGHQHMPLENRTLFGTHVCQPPDKAKRWARVDVRVPETGAPEIRSALCDAGEDTVQAIEVLLAPYEAETAVFLDAPLGHLDTALLPGEPLERALHGSWIANFFNQVQLEASGAELSATCLANELRGFSEDVTVRDIVASYVFPNTLRTIRVDRTVLKAVLERSAEYFALDDEGRPRVSEDFLKPIVQHYNFDFLSGVEVTADLRRPAGDRIVSIRYAGKELPDGQVLTLCLNNYRASGAGGYEAYAGCEVVRDQPEEISELIIRYVDAHREIRVDRTQWLKVNY